MTVQAIQFVKSGVVLREFPCDFYSLNWMNAIPAILNKHDRSVIFIPSPTYYDYIEVTDLGD